MKNIKKMIVALVVLAAIALVINIIVTKPDEKEESAENKTEQIQSNLETNEDSTEEETDQEESSIDENEPVTIEEKVDRYLKEMTLEEKIGQLMMIGFHGTEISSEIKDLVENKHVGGVIYFDRNMSSPKQVAQLSNDLQELAEKSGHPVPLMMAVDQEGGDILRMRERVSPIPSQQRLGNTASAHEVFEIAKINGAELDAMGIHLNFAPVLDLSSQDSRSFGTDPEKTFHYGKNAIEGLNASSVNGAIKHFPGNGRSAVDPHVDTSKVETSKEELEKTDLHPFKKMIQELDHQDFFVMVTHLKYPAYDKEKPASLSKNIIQDLLRDELGYEGIVITDDLEMGAVNKYYSYKDMGKDALLAGSDVLLVCHEYEHQLEVYNGIYEAVKNGEISTDRIDESVKRILTYKLSEIEQTAVDPERAENIVRSEEHLKVIEGIGQN